MSLPGGDRPSQNDLFLLGHSKAGPVSVMVEDKVSESFGQAKQVLAQYYGFIESVSEDLRVWAMLRQAPSLPFLPKDVHGKEVAILAIFYAGEVTHGKKLIEPLRHFGNPHGEHIGAQPYTEWQKAFDPHDLVEWGRHCFISKSTLWLE